MRKLVNQIKKIVFQNYDNHKKNLREFEQEIFPSINYFSFDFVYFECFFKSKGWVILFLEVIYLPL